MNEQPDPSAASPAPPRLPEPAGAADPRPLAHAELVGCLTHPHRMVQTVLGERRRLAQNLHRGTELRAVLWVLLACSVAFAVPFALVDGGARLLHVAILFVGSVLLCYPALQVFGSFLGLPLHPVQSLAVALVIPSAAALFTFAFAPIYWFLHATMPQDGGIGGSATRVVLLACSFALAMSHAHRCLFRDGPLRILRDYWPLWIGWQRQAAQAADQNPQGQTSAKTDFVGWLVLAEAVQR